MFEPNSVQHAKLLRSITDGSFKQFDLLRFDVTKKGFLGGTSRGLHEKEGNALLLLNHSMNEDLVIDTSNYAATVYLKFNHVDNPWLPFSLTQNTTADFAAICLTFQKFWAYNPVDQQVGDLVPDSRFIYALILKGVNLYAAAGYGNTGAY